MADQQSDMVYLGGLWVNTSKGGTKYFSGGLGIGGKILIFKNTKKDSDSQPDYNMFIAPKPKKNDDQGGTQPTGSDQGDVPF